MMGWPGFGGPGPHVVQYNGWAIAGMVILCVFVALVIAGIIIALVRMSRRGYMMHDMHGMHGDNALDIARERYAKGEINQEEFDKIKKNLS